MANYASEYYDPEKAHEYYMKNRELKGYENRYGGSRGNGTSAASTVGYQSEYKKQTETEKYKQAAKEHNETVKAQVQQANATSAGKINNLRSKMAQDKATTQSNIDNINNQIKNLQNSLKSMSKEEKKNAKETIRKQVNELREQVREMRLEQQQRNREYRLQIRELNLAKADEAQRLKQQTKGGSTSGFNQKGKEAAEYIKSQMETERDELIKKINTETDDKMLDQVKAFSERIKQMRDSGQQFSNKEFLAKTKSLLGKVKKTKAQTSRTQKEQYRLKYKDEIDKLRSDDSMFTYYDTRAKKLETYQKADQDYNEKWEARKRKHEADKAERARKEKERSAKSK